MENKILEEKLKNELGLVFSRIHIAKNGSYYRVAKPTEEFWKWYKDNKSELKENGFSVYKDEKHGFSVYDWRDKTVATNEEIEAYKREEEEWEQYRIKDAYWTIRADVNDRGDETWLKDIKEENYKTWNDISRLLGELYDNPVSVFKDYVLINIPSEFFFSSDEEYEITMRDINTYLEHGNTLC